MSDTSSSKRSRSATALRNSLRALGGQMGDQWERDRRDTLFLMGAIVLAVLPHVSHLPWWTSVGFGLLFLWRFGLEGGEATIPALDAMINKAAESETPVEEVVIGMAHRGRLNVLCNIVGKTYEQIFSAFEDKSIPDQSYGSGDVKYHQGYSAQTETLNGRTVYVKLLPNPSHLEAVNPVVEGFSRAKLDILYSDNYDRLLPILIHDRRRWAVHPGRNAIISASEGLSNDTIPKAKPAVVTFGTPFATKRGDHAWRTTTHQPP